jgi:hypothetical protein
LSVDPLQTLYADLNPYNFVAINPILYIDQDGKDYGVYVNHETKTIIVKETIHTLKGGSDAANANVGASKWNAESGKWLYVFGTGDNAIAYEIKFELTVKEHEDEALRDAAFASDNSGEGNLFKTDALNPNLYGRTTNPNDIRGFGYNYIQAQDNQYAREHSVYAHEIGHTLGLDHYTGGLMESGQKNKSSNITLGNVSRLLSYGGVGYPIETGPDRQLNEKSTSDIATIHTVGTAPIEFAVGTVQKTQD